MRILVLGSEGQIGNYLCDYIDRNYGTAVRWDIENSPEQDLRRRSPALDHAIQSSDFVFFLAFDVGGSRYLAKYQHTYPFLENNIRIMDTVFTSMKKYKKPFLFTSSQMSNMSYSPYGILKAVGEQYTKSLGGLVVKFWNVFGIEHDMEKAHVITDFIIKARDTGIIDMMTDGQESRQFLYADDACSALYELMLRYDEPDRDQELHVTSFRYTQIINLAKYIGRRLNAEVRPSIRGDLVQLDKMNKPDPYIKKFWTPTTKVYDGVDKVIEAMV